MVNKVLEKAAEEYCRESCNATLKPNIDGPMPEYGGNVKAGFIAGAKWQKRKMMEGALEGEVHVLPGHYAYVTEKYNRSFEQYILDNFKTGDDVAMIILLKEKEQ